MNIFLFKGQTTLKCAADKEEFASIAKTLEITLSIEEEEVNICH